MNLTATNTAIVLDSTADFPEAPKRFPNWRVVPLYVLFGDQSYRDYVELTPEEFYARLRSSERLPTTSQPTPDDKERVVDSETASAGIALLGLAIQRRLDRGTTDDELDVLIQRFKDEANLIFTVDTLEFLRRGGRLGRASAWAGQLLHVKPILTIEREVIPLKRVRGNQKAMQEFIKAFTSTTENVPTLKVGIAHADAPERAEQLRKMVRHERPQAEIELITTLGAVVGTHAGPGTVGFFWFDDRE
jgi:fatty acid-binding protein DegV